MALLLFLQLILPGVSVLAAEEINAPTNLKVNTYNVNDVHLTWDVVPGATSYRIYKINNNQLEKLVETGRNTWYKEFFEEGVHTFAVSAVNGTNESLLSSTVYVQIVYPEFNPPSSVSYTVYNGNDLLLYWPKTDYANAYKVYRIVNGNRELVDTATKTSTYISQLPEGEYVYEVIAFSERFGESKNARQITITLVHPIILPPSGLSYSVQNGNDILINWQKVDSAKEYKVYQVVDGTKEFVKSTTSPSFYLSNLPEGDYYYEVSTVSDRFGESKVASGIKISLLHPIIQPPSGLTYSIYNGNDILIYWQKADYAKEYKVFRIKDGKRELVTTTTKTSYYASQLPEDEYIFEVTTVSDRFGESKVTSQITIPLDYPVINPPSGLSHIIYNGNDVLIYWQKNDNAKEYNVYKIVDGKRELVSTTTKLSYYFSQLPEANYTFEVTTVSERFGESKEVSHLPVSIVYPVISAPKIDLQMQGRNTAYISWDKDDYGNFYNVYELVDGKPVYLEKTNTNSYFLVGLTDGTHEYMVTTVNSRFGESIYSNKVDAEVKPETPKIPAPPASEPTVEGDDVTLSWGAVEGASSYNIYKKINGEKVLVGSTTDTSLTVKDIEVGVHEFYIVPVSDSGVESAESTTVTVKAEDFDVTPPVTTSNAQDIWLKGEFTVELTATDDKSGVAKTYYSLNDSEFVEGKSFVVSEHGVNVVSFYSLDNSGNVEVTQTVEVKIDNQPPVTTSNITSLWLSGEFQVELTVTDDLSGVAKTFYSFTGTDFTEGTSFVVSEPGVKEVFFYSVDNAGNVEEENTVQLKIDENPPVTSSNAIEEWYKAFTLELTATDDLSGVAQTFYSVNGSEYKKGTSVVVTESGVNEVSFYSLDFAGNKEKVKTVQVKIDNTPPVTTTNAIDNWLTKSFTIELTAKDELSGVAQTFYSVNGSEFKEGTSVVVSESGVNEVSFYSVDFAGNKEVVQKVEVKIDNTPPVTTSNATDNWLSEAFTLELTATDALSGVAKTFYSINGSEFKEGTSVLVSESGVNEVTFYSIDVAGNKEEEKTIQVKIDNAPPVTTSNVTDKWLQGEFNLVLGATDDYSGVEKTFYSLNGADFVEATDVVINKEGINEVKFYSVDKAGNVEEKQTVQVKIDKTAPTFSWNLSNEYSLGTELKVNYLAEDNLSGISIETVTLNGEVISKGDTITFNQPGEYKIKVSVQDHAGWITTIEKTFVVYIPGELIVRPGIIKQNQGVFTVEVNLPKGFEPNFELSTVTLNGVKAKADSNGLVQQAKKGQFKFNRDDFNWSKGEVVVEFRGTVNGKLVVCKTTVTVK
jgi:large repetitive protein